MPRNAATTTYAEMEEEEVDLARLSSGKAKVDAVQSDHEDMDDDAFREPKRAAGARKEPGKSSQTRKAQVRLSLPSFCILSLC